MIPRPRPRKPRKFPRNPWHSHKHILFVGTMALFLLLGMNWWAYASLHSSRTRAYAAQQDWLDCAPLAQSITQLKGRPSRAAAAEIQAAEITQRLEQAAKSAGLGQGAAGNLARVWPETARRIGDTPFKEKPTQILLRQVSLKQLITFLYQLTTDNATLRVQTIRLTAPRGEETGDRWTTEVNLAQIIFAPPELSEQR